MKVFPSSLVPLLACTLPACAAVTVISPVPGSTDASPVHYVASATTTTCSKGVASMGIYVNNNLIYVVNGTSLNTSIAMANGPEHTVVEEWDYCGGATYATVDITVGTTPSPSVSITANPPTIQAGGSTTLTVNAANATKVIVTGSNGTTYTVSSTGGKETVTPTATTISQLK